MAAAQQKEYLSTREVAALLGVHEKQVYALVNAGRLPGTRATGKWLFPAALLREHLAADARQTLAVAPGRSRSADGTLLAAGSNDPLLDLLGSALWQLQPAVKLFTAATGSSDGLHALDAGQVDIAWSHLRDPVSGEYNLPFLPALLPRTRAGVITVFHRELGLVTAPGNPLGLRTWEDLARPGLRIVDRQPGSGTRLLLDDELRRLGLPPRPPEDHAHEVCTHLEVGLAVRSGEADVGLATESAARPFGLDFVPLVRERFDVVFSQSLFFTPGFQRLMDVLSSVPFQARTARLGNYDFRDCGKVLLHS